jgi:hypothetical protein
MTGREVMDPRIREDDEITPSFLRYYTSFLRRQESIPESGRRLVQRAIVQVLYISPAHQ